jgi:hypothetical protein
MVRGIDFRDLGVRQNFFYEFWSASLKSLGKTELDVSLATYNKNNLT